MLAIRLHEYTGIDGVRREEVPRPEPGPGELLLDVRAAGVNPVDWKIAEGGLRDFLGHTLPITLGCDVSGVVAGVGEGVDDLAVGDEVFGYVSLGRCGAFAEACVARTDEVARKPASLPHEEAAALPVAALTSMQALFDTAELSAGQTVLVHAAAGGVGSIAVQLARAGGARVIGTASAANEEFVRSRGADEFVDYRSTLFETVVRDVDVVYDTVGGETRERSFGVLREGGFLVSITAPPPEDVAARHGVRVGAVAVKPDAAQMKEVVRRVESGELRAHVAGTYPLEETVAALRENREGHTRGKIIVVP